MGNHFRTARTEAEADTWRFIIYPWLGFGFHCLKLFCSYPSAVVPLTATWHLTDLPGTLPQGAMEGLVAWIRKFEPLLVEGWGGPPPSNSRHQEGN